MAMMPTKIIAKTMSVSGNGGRLQDLQKRKNMLLLAFLDYKYSIEIGTSPYL